MTSRGGGNHDNTSMTGRSPFHGNASTANNRRWSNARSSIGSHSMAQSSINMSLSAASSSSALNMSSASASSSFAATTPAPIPSVHQKKSADKYHRNREDSENNDRSAASPMVGDVSTTHATAAAAAEDARLRSLITKSLLRNYHGGASTAVFYASILHAKQDANNAISAQDTLLYARSLAGNRELKRAVLLLERKGLLLGRTTLTAAAHSSAMGGTPNDYYTNTTSCAVCERMEPCDYIEAALLANHCLSESDEVEDACVVLEEVCRFPFPSKSAIQNCSGSLLQLEQHFPTIENGDDVRLMELAQVIRSDATSNTSDCDCDKVGDVHPLAQLCFSRGKAYDMMGNSERAVPWLRAAMFIDVFCIDAMEYLLDRHLMNVDEERALLESLSFGGGGQQQSNGSNSNTCNDDDDGRRSSSNLNWLRDLYFARLNGCGMKSTKHAAAEIGQGNNYDRDVADGDHQHHDSMNNNYTVPSGFGELSHIYPPSQQQQQQQQQQQHESSHYGTPVLSFGINHSERNQPSPFTISETPLGFGKLNGDNNGDNNKSKEDAKIPAEPSSSDSEPDEIEEAFGRLRLEHQLGESADVLALAARRAYALHRLPLAAHYCEEAQKIDPLCPRHQFLHVVTLFGLERKQDLFYLAHQLVDAQPKAAVSWFAVGCYYQLCGKYDLAQRHFGRSTRLDARCVEAWVAFGCAFAAADESDQALAAFRAAQRLHSSGHIPMLYMGMEYLRTNHISLAGHFLSAASRLNSYDPLSFNELGVCAYRQEKHHEAVEYFTHALKLHTELDIQAETQMGEKVGHSLGKTRALHRKFGATGRRRQNREFRSNDGEITDSECISRCTDPFWEPTIFNLGQSYRKIHHYEEAKLCFEKSVVLTPGHAPSHAALGFSKHLMGDIDGAIESYHQSLSIKPDDAFTNEMLNRALQESLMNPITFSVTEERAAVNTTASRLSFGSSRAGSLRDRSAVDSSMATEQSSHFTLDCSGSDVSMS